MRAPFILTKLIAIVCIIDLFQPASSLGDQLDISANMTWSASLPEDLKHTECERTDVSKNGGAPPVRTVPDEVSDADPQTVSIYTSEDVKEQFHKFDGGSQERAIIHTATFFEIINKLNLEQDYGLSKAFKEQSETEYAALTTPQRTTSAGRQTKAEIEEHALSMKEYIAKAFKIFQDLLDTKLVPDWLACVKLCCKTTGFVTWDGIKVTGVKRGMDFDSLKATIRHWMIETGTFPHDSAERIEKYVSTQIKMPTRKDLEFKAWVKRIIEICNYLPLVPCMKDVEGSPAELPRANVKPSGLKLCQYILEAIPSKWSNMYWS